MDKEERLRKAAEDDWGVAYSKEWKPESPLKFSKYWYYAHLYLMAYLLTGFSILMYQVADNQIYRITTIVNWPWVFTSTLWIFAIAILFYVFALIWITSEVVKQMRNFPLNALNIGYFFLYYLGALIMIVRFLMVLVTPEPIELI